VMNEKRWQLEPCQLGAQQPNSELINIEELVVNWEYGSEAVMVGGMA
jgi:hypothetical protein